MRVWTIISNTKKKDYFLRRERSTFKDAMNVGECCEIGDKAILSIIWMTNMVGRTSIHCIEPLFRDQNQEKRSEILRRSMITEAVNVIWNFGNMDRMKQSITAVIIRVQGGKCMVPRLLLEE